MLEPAIQNLARRERQFVATNMPKSVIQQIPAVSTPIIDS
jgi:hypothetical protein